MKVFLLFISLCILYVHSDTSVSCSLNYEIELNNQQEIHCGTLDGPIAVYITDKITVPAYTNVTYGASELHNGEVTFDNLVFSYHNEASQELIAHESFSLGPCLNRRFLSDFKHNVSHLVEITDASNSTLLFSIEIKHTIVSVPILSLSNPKIEKSFPMLTDYLILELENDTAHSVEFTFTSNGRKSFNRVMIAGGTQCPTIDGLFVHKFEENRDEVTFTIDNMNNGLWFIQTDSNFGIDQSAYSVAVKIHPTYPNINCDSRTGYCIEVPSFSSSSYSSAGNHLPKNWIIFIGGAVVIFFLTITQ